MRTRSSARAEAVAQQAGAGREGHARSTVFFESMLGEESRSGSARADRAAFLGIPGRASSKRATDPRHRPAAPFTGSLTVNEEPSPGSLRTSMAPP